jgi:tRNA (adenine57-N1/adenine58-N1)-methyltransferase
VSEPWNYVGQVASALRGGAFFATLVPTMNQVIPTVQALEGGPFGLLEVEELLLRPYKAVSTRVRPADRMVAHTGYLIFARKVESVQPRLSDQAAGVIQSAGDEADTAETEPDEQPD